MSRTREAMRKLVATEMRKSYEYSSPTKETFDKLIGPQIGFGDWFKERDIVLELATAMNEARKEPNISVSVEDQKRAYSVLDKGGLSAVKRELRKWKAKRSKRSIVDTFKLEEGGYVPENVKLRTFKISPGGEVATVKDKSGKLLKLVLR